jgi:hypothetical protein
VGTAIRWPILLLSILVLVVPAIPSSATHNTNPSLNMQALGHSPHAAIFDDPPGAQHINSDLAFWGNLAFNGNYDGFRIIDISNPANPTQLAWEHCNGPQGDIVVWEDILIRSWDSPNHGPSAIPAEPSQRMCDGSAVPSGFEGLHVWDISNLSNPTLVGSLALECGSHTATLAGVEGGNLILYNNISSSTRCFDNTNTQSLDDPLGDFMDIVAVPLANPGGINLVRREPLAGPGPAIGMNPAPRTGCHDVGVIRLDVNRAACASADTINVWDIGANGTPGGSLTDPEPLFTITEPGVGQSGTNGRWHSAAFTWDGQVIAAGWEPGGGGEAECQATDPDVDKSMFFFNGTTGAKLGQWVLPRAQGPDENCTIHNYNVVPMRNNRHIVVGGHYQAGTWAVDFTNPAAPEVLAYSDPPSLGPGPHCAGPGQGTFPPGCLLGGAWSSYWYNDYVYESDITRGLNVYRVTHARLAPGLTINQPFLNPQTQIEAQSCKGEPATHLGTNGKDKIRGTPEDDVVVALGGKDNVKTRSGDDLVCAGGGRDGVQGKGGDDRLYGQGGSDRLNGGAGQDRCVGGPGRDRVRRCEAGRA